eukprot:m.49687 g.49687  ORF g.49687 m.49687 type:complete len:313 (+) comp12494_c0_seq1:183-1121(+)
MKWIILCAALALAHAAAAADQVNSCGSAGILTSDACSTSCQSEYSTTAHVYESQQGSISCTCVVNNQQVPLCSDDAPQNADVPTVSELRDWVAYFLDPSCRPAVDRAITNTAIYTCYQDVQNAIQGLLVDLSSLGDVCANDCLHQILRTVSILVDANCLDLATDDDMPFGGDDDTQLDVTAGLAFMASAQVALDGMCARSSTNNRYCGELAPTLAGSTTVDTCNTIVDFGNCFGTLLHAAQSIPSFFNGTISGDVNQFETDVVGYCASVNVAGVDASAQGTEAPANLASSSATGITSLIGTIMTLAIAAILA